LVLEAFVGPPHEKGALCIHKNGIRDDNVLSNLQWLSKAEAAVSRTGKHARFNHLTPDQVSEIRSSTASARELAEKFGVRPKTIIRVRRGETQPQERTRLTSEQRATIVESEEPDNELAKKYGVSVRSIKQLRKEAAWRDVTHYRRLSPEEAMQVLQSNESAEVLARLYGVATKSIQGIRSGRAHKKVYELFQRMKNQQQESDDAK
jgi:transcriptional regulator with XRE-family HTH domain